MTDSFRRSFFGRTRYEERRGGEYMAVKEVRESELCVLNAQTTAEHIAKMVSETAKRGLSAKYLPSMMLWGAPGVGKSQAVRRAAEEIERITGRKVVITDVRLLLYNPVDLRGIPSADEHREFAVWLKPRLFAMDESKDVINILFLDELTAAPQSVQAAAYQITLDRMVGEHRLPDNCFVIAAGNRMTDRSVVFKMPKALANRLCHVEVEADFGAWHKWALKNDIDLSVIGFLCYDNESLMKFGGVADEVAFPTPRSWEMASRMITLYGGIEEAMPFVCGCVGNAAAAALLTWSKVWNQLPSMEDIFSGKTFERPTRPDALYALVSSMTAYARKPEVPISNIIQSVRYGVKLPCDYAMLLFKGYLQLDKCEDMKSVLVRCREFSEWLNKNGRYMDI